MSGCDRVVISKTQAQGNTTSVTWLAYEMTGLTGFLVTLSQNGVIGNAEAGPTATTASVDFTAGAECVAVVTPRTADGPSAANASFSTPVPFPPTPIDPASGRPEILRVCADATSVSVNWLPSGIPDLQGYFLTITENGSNLENFEVDGGDAVAKTVDYVCKTDSSYSITLTPFDDFGPDYSAVSYSQDLPYPNGPA
jgi:hypothetical protein